MSVNKARVVFLAVPVLLAGLNGCANNGTAGSQLGTLVGAGGGAYLGSTLGKKLGGTEGQIIGGLVGGAVGGMIGQKIGQWLDPEEKKQASIATQRALDSEVVGSQSTTTWTSPTNPGNAGGTTITQQTQSPSAGVCKVAKSFATVKGKDVQVTETYCRDPQTGTWTLQQA
ncbi:MAG: glycine zipper 2TM domain-containing protein [Methylovulum sp.]|nr:glycine zipper 2TM domain-containing protein [Methylovulum sp.]